MYPQMQSYDAFIDWEGMNFFPFRDKSIDEYHNRLSVKEIKDLILDDKLISKGDILEQQDIFYSKLQYREKNWDIKALDFINKSIKQEKLFFDPNHPTGVFFKYIASELLKMLGMSADNVMQYDLYELDLYEMPIYASVISTFDLQYNTNTIRKSNGLKLNDRLMDLEEYIRQYILWNFR